MKRFFIFFSILLATTCWGTQLPTSKAVLRTMDKVTGRVMKVDIPVGEDLKIGSLTVFIHKCLTHPPEETPENSVYLTITEQKDKKDIKVFEGWMFSSHPDLSAMEHPVYDIWLLECQGIK